MIAILCSLLANIHSRGRTYEPADFMPSWDGSSRRPSSEDLIARFEKLFGDPA